MSKIIRTPSKAHGGITSEEKLLMDAHAQKWIGIAMRTDPIEPDKIIPAIKGIYAAANLKEPRVIIVPSPMVMAFAYGASAAIWHVRKTSEDIATANATRIATRIATDSATRNATDSATRNATDSATRIATRIATDNAENGAAAACLDLAGSLGIECARRWGNNYQGGNMWAGYDCYLTSCRDILGLKLTSHAAYSHWEQAAIHGGFRVMHEEFCLVSDFPEVLRVDDQNRPHCETGPSHRWRDGWALYHLWGIKVPAEWIENRDTIDPSEILKSPNVEQRAVGMRFLGARMISALKPRILDGDPNSEMGALVEVRLDGFPEPGRYLQAKCPRNNQIFEGVPRVSDVDGLPIETALHAQAWRVGDPLSEYVHPEVRT